MPTTIQVSDHVKAQLDEIKERNGHTSMDSVVRFLISEGARSRCKGEKCTWYWNCEKYGCPGFKEKEEG